MSRVTMLILLFGGLFFSFSCSDKSTNPENTNKNMLCQIPGCGYNFLAKTALEPGDSLFSYQFDEEKLLIDFCVTANCCPDSNRFSLSYEILSDSLAIAVEDTADGLCNCVCPYIIHVELYDLPLNHYVFSCNYYNSIVYLEDIQR